MENLSSEDDGTSSVNPIRREITEVCASGKGSLINNTTESFNPINTVPEEADLKLFEESK